MSDGSDNEEKESGTQEMWEEGRGQGREWLIPILLTFLRHCQSLFQRCLCKLVTVAGQIPAREAKSESQSANEEKEGKKQTKEAQSRVIKKKIWRHSESECQA